MITETILSIQNLEDFDFEGTIKNLNKYFRRLERIKWEFAKLNAGKGLTANYNFALHYKNHNPYISFGKDEFGFLIKESKEEELKRYISSYYWAKSILADKEKIYINERFINNKHENELLDLLGFYSIDSRDFRRFKKIAIYKFADFLNLVIRKD